MTTTIRDVHEPQSRERAVGCRECQRPTWNVTARCDQHSVTS